MRVSTEELMLKSLGDMDVLEFILAHGGDANCVVEGEPILHHAAHYGYSEACKMLIEHGAKVDAYDEEGFTALHYAAHFNTYRCCEALINGGADVNLKDKKGRTAYMMASAKDNIACAHLLIMWGAENDMDI